TCHLMIRAYFFATLTLMTGLYALQFEQTRSLEDFAGELRALLKDESADEKYGEENRIARMNGAIYLIVQAEERGIAFDKLFARSCEGTEFSAAYMESLKTSLHQNRMLAEDLGLFTEANRYRLDNGESPIITRGGFQGEHATLKEIIPEFLAPEASVDFANLRFCPESLREEVNFGSFDKIEIATRLHHAKIVSSPSYRRVLTAYHNG
ncbi:MAG: hypothetical protein AAGA58_20540, partial [Verrucomicrobiota bacterium]